MGGSQMQSCRLLSIIVTGLLFLMSLSGYCFGEELSVTMLNVGQADAFLVQTAGKRVLIDAGEKGDADTILEYLHQGQTSDRREYEK